MKYPKAAVIAIFAVAPISLQAVETTTYVYDAKGRLVVATRAGTVDAGKQSIYQHDRVDNRVTFNVGPPPGPSLSIADAAAVTEGGTLVFTVTRAGGTSSAVTVNYASGGGTAAAGADYTAVSGTLSFAAGETVKTIVVATIDDASAESSEDVQVTLSAPSGGSTISTSTATGSINDNDGPPPPIMTLNPGYGPINSATIVIGLNALANTYFQPAIITGFAPPANAGTAVIASDGGSVTYTAPPARAGQLCEAATTLDFAVPYTIRNISTNAVAAGTVTITVEVLPGPQPVQPAVCP